MNVNDGNSIVQMPKLGPRCSLNNSSKLSHQIVVWLHITPSDGFVFLICSSVKNFALFLTWSKTNLLL